MISIDSLRADHLGCYGYERDTSPTIDWLAAEGVRFDSAISTTSWTLPAHAALFTGLYDSSHGLVDDGLRLSDHHVTLAEMLRDAGYRTAGFYGGPYLHPSFGLAQGFEHYESCMSLTPAGGAVHLSGESVHAASHRDVTGPRTAAAFASWLATADDRPFFIFLHLWDVHYDYTPPKEYIDLFDPDYDGEASAEGFITNKAVHAGMPARDLERIIALYDAEIRFTDDMIARMLQTLDNAGRLEGTLIVITADHGDEFFEHGGKGHRHSLFDEVIRVPLIIHWAGRNDRGLIVPDQVRLIDIMPTILALVGAPAPADIQGRNLGPLLRGESLLAAPALCELLFDKGQARCLRSNGGKLIIDGGARKLAFFDLQADPGEVHPIGKRDVRTRAATAQLRMEMKGCHEWLRRFGHAPVTAIDVDRGIRRRLDTLGYLAGDEDGEDESSQHPVESDKNAKHE